VKPKSKAAAKGKVTVKETTVGRALKALVLENEWLSATVLLDHGADINTLVYKPKGSDVVLKPPLPPREPGVGPPPAGDSMSQWISYYRGGWQVIFPNFGPAVEHKGAPLDFHGEAARTAWHLEEIQNNGAQAQVVLGVALQKSPFRIRRVMSVASGQPKLSITETITNQGEEAMECMWGHHPAFGPPLVSPACMIETGARMVESDDGYDVSGNNLPLGQCWTWPRVRNKNGEEIDLSKLPAPGSGHSRVLYLKDFKESWFALTNPTLGLGVGMVWDGKLFPYAALWQETGGVLGYPFYGKAYVVALEPNSSYPAQGLPKVMEKTGTHLTLAPGESRTLELSAVFFEPSRRIKQIDLGGRVQFV